MSKIIGGVHWHAAVEPNVFTRILLKAAISCTGIADSLDKYPVRAEVTFGLKHPNEGRNNKLCLIARHTFTFYSNGNSNAIELHVGSINVPIYTFILRVTVDLN
jgi:hypothetical protein